MPENMPKSPHYPLFKLIFFCYNKITEFKLGGKQYATYDVNKISIEHITLEHIGFVHHGFGVDLPDYLL